MTPQALPCPTCGAQPDDPQGLEGSSPFPPTVGGPVVGRLCAASRLAPSPHPVVADLTEVGVRAGVRWLVRDVDLALHAGEIVTLIGPNGAGKTTLVKALLGLVPLTTGQVRRPPARQIGYVPQRLTLDPVLPLTVHRLMTATRTASRARVRAALADCGVDHLIDAPAHSLSGGELQRVLLARALARDPRLLVLDEPVQGVDYAGEAALYDLIAGLRNRLGCAVLMVSHDLHVVMAATDRVVCLNQTIRCSGPPRAVSGSPPFQALFGPRAGALAVYAHDHPMPDEPRPAKQAAGPHACPPHAG